MPRNNLKPFLTLFLLFLSCHCIQAKTIGGNVYIHNEIGERKVIYGINVQLLSARDSSVIANTVTKRKSFSPNPQDRCDYTFEVGSDSCYLLRFSYTGYKTIIKRVRTVFEHNQNFIQVQDVVMEEASHLLSEVVVKATKIKMVMKGDTIVYNADAFNVAEGSMLDALIRQLPGCKLHNGVITVNGQTVSSLLVDGRNFFNGDAKLALEHLPAYTVDKVKVYKHSGEESRLMGEDMGDKSLVVDVNLKKKYKVGNMTEVAAGGGTHDRYGAQIHDMLFSKKLNFNVTTKITNAGDFSRVTDDLENSQDNGDRTSRNINFMFGYNGKTFDDRIGSITSMGHDDVTRESRTSDQQFLTGGDLFNINRQYTRSHVLGINSKNSFMHKFDNHILSLKFDVYADKDRNNSFSRSAQLDTDPNSVVEALDSIFMDNPLERWTKSTLNKVWNKDLSKSNNQSYIFSISDRLAFGKKNGRYNNNITLNADLTYNRAKSKKFDMSNIDYVSSGKQSDDRYTYYDSPSHSYNYSLSAQFGQRLSRRSAQLNRTFAYVDFGISQSYKSDESGIYRLDHLSDFISQDNTIGMLPSSRDDLQSVFDDNNSNSSQMWNRNSTAKIRLNYQHGDGLSKPKLLMDATVPLRLQYEKIAYFQQKDYSKKRTTFFFEPKVNLNYAISDSIGSRSAIFDYETKQGVPTLMSMLDTRRDDNPLYIREGNPSLKKTRNHKFNVIYNNMSYKAGNQSWITNLNYTVIQDAIGTLVSYDRNTGVTTSRQVNVNGNWNAGGSVEWNRGLDKNHNLDISAHISGTYGHSVDLNQTADNEDLKSKVYRTDLTGMLTLSYHPTRKFNAMLIFSVNNNRANGSRDDFQDVSVYNYLTNFLVNADLPLGIKVSTSFSDYKMSGYNDPTLNKNSFVWNARLSKDLLKNRLSLVVTAYDLLGQVDKRFAVVNEQGRTETWTNSIPQYIMAHLTYKFNLGMKR